MSSSTDIVRMIGKKVNMGKNINDAVLVDICEALRKIRYGSVQIHIQDGKVIQIDKVNKVRMR